MFGKKKETKGQPRSTKSLAQYGIFDIPDDINDVTGEDENNEDYEAELAALTMGNDNGYKRKHKAERKLLPSADIDAMVAESMKDINSDEDVSDGENDSALLSELKLITEGDSPPVNVDDIPHPLPVCAVTDTTTHFTVDDASPSENISTESPDSVPLENQTISQDALDLLKQRQQEYKTTAVAWKRAGNMEEALRHAKQLKIIAAVISAGEAIDLSDIPPAPSRPPATATVEPAVPAEKEQNEIQQDSVTETPVTVEDTPVHHGAENMDSALKERLEVYRRSKTTAEQEGNSSKARRYGRICKQFEDALKLHSRGQPVPIDDLPIPPGFPPLSVPQSSVPPPANEVQANPSVEIAAPDDSNAKISPQRKLPQPSPQPNTVPNQSQKVTSRAEKQMLQLQQRQHELKQAALSAKKDGDLELARDYLRQAKGLQPLIEASKAGLPVDMNSIPLSPLAKIELNAHKISGQVDDSFTLISTEDCVEEPGGTDEQIYDNLESQLIKQVKWCLSTRDHSKALGDVPGYNRWERLALSYTRDLDMLRVRKRDALPPPQHHYETKTYAIVQSCTDLNDSDIEISIIRGVSYSKEADTYVMFEFPFPSDNPPASGTSTIKGSSNPEYQAVFPLTGIIDRSSRQCQRAFKRHALKCQVWAKGCSLNPILCCTHPRGFFKSDSLIGTVAVKLQPLETLCILHDSFPLMEGRKKVGGKLELKIRLRNPILAKQIEQITDKWLSIDH